MRARSNIAGFEGVVITDKRAGKKSNPSAATVFNENTTIVNRGYDLSKGSFLVDLQKAQIPPSYLIKPLRLSVIVFGKEEEDL